ncbi:MAG: aldehyde dehydrogenase family protein [Solirubrobacteraceae bacterium]|nr:aldehyde dehydrogenase family protein [Solirubrobacteraceae bacterium]
MSTSTSTSTSTSGTVDAPTVGDPGEASVMTLHHRIGDAWTTGSGGTIDLVDPATQRVIARLPTGSPEDVDAAVAAAAAAQPAWAALPLEDRLSRLERFADALEAHAAELAELECREMGKPVDIGEAFVLSGVEVLRASIADARTYAFVETQVDTDEQLKRVLRRPLGVVAQIVPWNFTVAATLLGLGPLLAAGNAVVWKPSERAPLSGVRMAELADDLPPGVLNLVLGDRRAGEPLADHPDVGLVHFTGSVPSGRSVAGSAAGHLRRAVLELGGKDPVVVDAGVDVDATAEAVAFGAFVNTGQICTSMERIYVHRDVADAFVAALVAQAEQWTMGDGHDEGVRLGPLVDERQRRIVHEHVTDAVRDGATVLTGGEPPDRTGFFYPATVLVDVDDDMLIMREETFGPVAPIKAVDSFEEGLRRAADSRFGLAATVYTTDPDHAALCDALPVGVVWVNEWQGGGLARTYEPAGDSGSGATGGHAAYDAATRPVTVVRTGVALA